MDALKRIEKIIQDNASEQKKKKPRLKFNPGLALTDLRATRPRDRRLHQFRRPKFEFDSAHMKYSVCTGPKDRFFPFSVVISWSAIWWMEMLCCSTDNLLFTNSASWLIRSVHERVQFFIFFLEFTQRDHVLLFCYLFKRWKLFFCINRIPKIMVQFCYLRLCTVNLFPVVCCKGWQE